MEPKIAKANAYVKCSKIHVRTITIQLFDKPLKQFFLFFSIPEPGYFQNKNFEK